MAPNALSDTRDAIRADPLAFTCQICLDELPFKDFKPVTHFCSSTCPAVLCSTCLQKHLQLSMQVAYTGALPKVRCPVCIVPVNKQQWTRFLSPDASETQRLLEKYRRLCTASCNFTCPGCHDAQYTQLPEYKLSFADHANAIVLTLRPSEKTRIPELRRVVGKFCRHRSAISAHDVIRHITDNFPISKTDCIIHKIFALIQDEERRATLLLAYHSIHRRVVTRCCGSLVCFNCKRYLYDASTPCTCETEDLEVIADDNIIECRSCRVMLVKVDGCSSVMCVCGFWMDWEDEKRTKQLHQRKLLPVDPSDVSTYSNWTAWRYDFQRATDENFSALRESAMLHAFNSCRGVRESLRQLVWKRRFRRIIKDAELELCHKFAVRQHPTYKESLRALVWRRRRFHWKLLQECRTAFVVRTARLHSAPIWPVVQRLMWFCRFRYRVLGALLRRFYCLSRGWGELSQEQLEVHEDMFELLTVGLN